MLHCGFGGGKDSGECWTSAPLQNVMYKGAHAVASDTLKQPTLDLERSLATDCPFHKDLCGLRWRPYSLLATNSCCVDLAFLEGVFRYSTAVGKTKFPAGNVYKYITPLKKKHESPALKTKCHKMCFWNVRECVVSNQTNKCNMFKNRTTKGYIYI